MYGPPAFIGGRMTDHFPSEAVIASPFCPAMLTVTFSPALAVPAIRSGFSRWSTILSE